MSIGFSERVILAAELLHLDPDDLLSKLDPPIDDETTWGWQGDPVAPNGTERPAPRGLGAYAHWSASHAGINVEIDAPKGMPLTVHINDWEAASIVVGVDDTPLHLPGATTIECDPTTSVTIEQGTVYLFTLSNPDDAAKYADDVQRILHDGQDVLVVQLGDGLVRVEALDGAEFFAWRTELTDDATTPADRFAGHRP